MRRPRRPAQDLRFTIECLPRHTREAMLEGIEQNQIIVGAYTDRDGGVCPMLAAHRRGGRTSLASFARAWDRYTRAGRKSRMATNREVRTLTSMLQSSLATDELAHGEFAHAVAELKEIKARREAETRAAQRAEPAAADDRRGANGDRRARPATGERDRSSELRHRPGWAWLRVFRRYDEYESALERVRRAERELERRAGERRELERV